MKKLLLLGLVAMFSVGAYAQFQMGLKVGVNSSITKIAYNDSDFPELEENYDENTSHLMGLNLAFVMNTGGKVFSFQPEFAYSQRGSADADDDSYSRMNYFDIKPMFNIGGGGENWRVYSHFGPTLNIWLSKASYDDNGDKIDGSDDWYDDSNDDGTGVMDIRADFGFVVGIGAKYKLGPGWILINPRYEWGFIPQTIVDMGSTGYGIVNRTFSFNTGYLYEF